MFPYCLTNLSSVTKFILGNAFLINNQDNHLYAFHCPICFYNLLYMLYRVSQKSDNQNAAGAMVQRFTHQQLGPPESGNSFWGRFLLRLSMTKHSKVMPMGKFCPTAHSCGQDFVLLVLPFMTWMLNSCTVHISHFIDMLYTQIHVIKNLFVTFFGTPCM